MIILVGLVNEHSKYKVQILYVTKTIMIS